ncbi:unnamed protein product, partial [Ixodes persulcatus]
LAVLLADKVKLRSPVMAVAQEADHVVVTTQDGQRYKGSHVIMAMSPTIQMKMHYSPPLPPLRNQMLQRMPLGSVWKCLVYYKEPFWRKKGYSGSMLFTLAEDCPVVYTLDDTKPDGSYPAIIGFLPANKARTVLKLNPEQRKQLIIKGYAEAMKTEEALHPIHYEEFNWAGQQYSGGCYTSMIPPGLLTTFRSVLRDPIGRLFFAGTETATEWSGYINGGIQAGERAAREVLHAQGKLPKDQVWQKEPPNDLIVSQPFVDTFAEKYMPSVPAFLTAASLLAVPGLALSCFLLVKRDLLRFNYSAL